jgi:hypothetical protein
MRLYIGLRLFGVSGTRDTLENTMDAKKIAVVGLLVAVVALAACRREEARPLKLGGPDLPAPAQVAR